MQKKFTINDSPVELPDCPVFKEERRKKPGLLYTIMKVTLIQVTVAMIFSGVSIAFDNHAQEILKRRISLELNESSLVEALKAIESAVQVKFVYSPARINLNDRISIDVSNRKLGAVLSELLTPRSIRFQVQEGDEYIILVEEDTKVDLLRAEDAVGEADMLVEVSGSVTDPSGNPMPGVNIVEKGTTNGTTTDAAGKYALSLSVAEPVLVFSFIGYITQEVAVNGSSVIDVSLAADVQSLQEIVVVGYGQQKKVNVTGSITSVKTGDINNIPLSNLSNGIAGRAPGVQVVGTSGLAGASSSIRIRGSFGDPLYVINGIIKGKADFDALNPNEVESINFLKDAASASIYGSSAGNGVVLVTTKVGTSEKPTFEYKGNYSASNPTRPLQDFTAQEELIYVNNTAVTRGQPEPYGQEILNYFSDKSYSINDLIWQQPTVQEHNLSLSGGSENVKYYMLLGYHTEKGSYKNLGYDRYNFRSDINAKVTDRLKVNVNISGNQRNYDRWYWPYDGAEDFSVGDFYRSTFNWTRLYPFYVDAQGNPTNDPKDIPVKPAGGWHPPQLMLNEGGYRHTKYRSLDGILRFDLDLGELLEGLSTSAQGNINAYDRNMKSLAVHNNYYIFQPASASNMFIPGPVDFTQTGSHNLSSNYENIQENINLVSAYQVNWFLNFTRSFGKHDVSALAVYELAGSKSKSINGRADELLSSSIDQIYNASSDSERRWFDGGEGEFARASWIGRASYAFNQKYIAEFSFRYDGNYKFAPGKRFGFFPSVSGAWRAIEEPFLQNITWLNDLKLRASYGTTGSDSEIGAWRWGQNYQKTTGYVFGNSMHDGLIPGPVPNPDITWSTVSLWDVGVDFGFMNNRLSGEFDIWQKTESDILGTRLGSTPTTYGAALPAVNYAERSWKGIEVALNWKDQIGEFKYSVYGNMGFARDQWDLFDEPAALTDGTYAENWRSVIGKPENRIGGYVSKGIIRTQAQLDALADDFTQFGRAPQLGTILFADIRGANYSEGPDGKIDGNDWTYLSDNGAPRINYGFGLNTEWKGISINAHFQGIGAYDRMISTRNGGGVFQVDRPYFELWASDYWTPENPDATYPRVAGNWMQEEFGGGPSSFWMRNGAYLRLKNLNIGYALPGKWSNSLSIQKIQVYGNATNLFVVTDLKEHDPEQTTLDSYPLMKTFTAGLIVQF